MDRSSITADEWHADYEQQQKQLSNGESSKTYEPKGNNPIALLQVGINYEDYLVGQGFIEKGTAGLLAGPSGIGKSSIAMQKAVLWSIGKKAFDLEPTRPLRIVLTQTEDSNND